MGRSWTITTGTHIEGLNWWGKSFSRGGRLQRTFKAASERYVAKFACLAKLDRAVPTTPLRITLTRIAPCKLDGDNLRGGFKRVRDGVADALGIDDRESPMLSWEYKQERGGVREYGLRIEIEELE